MTGVPGELGFLEFWGWSPSTGSGKILANPQHLTHYSLFGQAQLEEASSRDTEHSGEGEGGSESRGGHSRASRGHRCRGITARSVLCTLLSYIPGRPLAFALTTLRSTLYVAAYHLLGVGVRILIPHPPH